MTVDASFIAHHVIVQETKEQLKGKILIVDLAGSERLKKSLTTAEMQKACDMDAMFRKPIMQNKSLELRSLLKAVFSLFILISCVLAGV